MLSMRHTRVSLALALVLLLRAPVATAATFSKVFFFGDSSTDTGVFGPADVTGIDLIFACGEVLATTSAPECFAVRKNGRPLERRCDVIAPDDLRFRTVAAADEAGNEVTRDCETVIGKPPRGDARP